MALRGMARSVILGAEDGESGRHPEAPYSTPKMAAHSWRLETGDSACSVADREARNEAWKITFLSGKFAV